MFLPVYRGDAAPQTVAQRRDQLIGFLYTAFRAADIGRSLRQASDPEIVLQVFEGETWRYIYGAIVVAFLVMLIYGAVVATMMLRSGRRR